METLLSLAGSVLPFAHFGGLAAAAAFPPLAFLGNGRWKLILLGVVALAIAVVIVVMKLHIGRLEVEIATQREAFAEVQAKQAAAAAEENARAIAALQKRHGAELAALAKQRDQAKAAITQRDKIREEIDHAPDASLPAPRAFDALLAGVRQ